MPWSTRILSLCLAALAATACRADKNHHTDGTLSAADDNTGPKFRIFDQSYNFLSPDNLSDAAYARDNFPVYSDPSSKIADLDPDDLYSARFKLLDSATKSVRIQVLTYWADETGWRLTEKLIALKKKGLDVKVIVDGVANLGLPTQKMFFELQQNGIEVAGFEPFFMFLIEEVGPLDSYLSFLQKMNLRFHEKMFIVDGEDPANARAIVGGANLSNHYFRVDTEHPENMWTDQDVMLKGKVLESVINTFDENFKAYQAHRLLRMNINPDTLWNWAIERAKKAGKDGILTIKRPDYDPKIVAELERMESADLKLTWHDATMRYIRNRPRNSEFYIGDAFLSMLSNATQHVEIASSFFIPDDTLIDAVAAAARRGVHVKILTNSLQTVRFQPMVLASRSRYAKLLAVNKETLPANGGVEIYEWQGKDATPNGQGLFHAKYALFDGEAAMVGSYNLDPRSMKLDSEGIIAVLDANFVAKLGTRFDAQVSADFSKAISASDAEAFNQSETLVERFKAALSEKMSPLL